MIVDNRTITWRVLLIYAAAAMMVALITHQNMVRRGFASDAVRVGVPIAGNSSDFNDNYLYFSLLKRGSSACRDPADDHENDASGNALSCTYLPALIADHALYQAIRAVTPNHATALGLLMISQTALLAFAALVALGHILRRRFGFLSASALAGIVILLSDAFAWSLLFGRIYPNLQYIWRFEANTVRLVNPTLFWTFGLLAIASLLSLLDRTSVSRYLVVGVMLLLTATSSIAVGANLLAGVCFAVAIILVFRRRIHYPLLFAAIILTIGLAWQQIGFFHYYGTEMGAQLRHGRFIGLDVNLSFLVLLVPILLGRIGIAGANREIVLKSLLAGSMLLGVFNGSVELGDRLWLRGGAMIALVLSMAWLITYLSRIGRTLFQDTKPADWLLSRMNSRGWNTLASVSLIIALTAFSNAIRPFDPQRWYGFVERDKYEALSWIADHAKRSETVASGNIDDSTLLDFYTDATPFIGFYGTNSLTLHELMRRYFYVLDLLQDSDKIANLIVMAKQSDILTFYEFVDGPATTLYDYDLYQMIGFYELMVYHTYNAATPNLFESGRVDQAFVQLVERMREEAKGRKYDFRYLLLRSTDDLKEPERFQEVFRNAQYVVYSPERTDRAVP
ncbi:MAG: hypothetical protein ACYC10_19045 [Allorhizobium sp.]